MQENLKSGLYSIYLHAKMLLEVVFDFWMNEGSGSFFHYSLFTLPVTVVSPTP
jgi:hypothetical protein